MFEVLRNKGAVYQEADDVMAKVAQMNMMNDKEIDNYEDEDDEDELDIDIDDLLDGIDEEDIERGSSEFEADIADYMNSRLVAMDIKEEAELDEIDTILSSLEEDVLGEGARDNNVADGSADKESEQGESGSLKKEVRATKQDQPKVPHDAENFWTIEPAKKDEGRTSGNKSAYAEDEEINIDDYDFSIDEGCKDCNDADGSHGQESEQGESGSLKRELRATQSDQPKVPHDREDFWAIDPSKKDEGRSTVLKSAYAEDEEINIDDYDFSIDEDSLEEGVVKDTAKKGAAIGAGVGAISGAAQGAKVGAMMGHPIAGAVGGAIGGAARNAIDGGLIGAGVGKIKEIRDKKSAKKDKPKTKKEELDMIDEFLDEGCKDCNKKEADKMGNATKGDRPLNEDEIDESVDFEKISEPARGTARSVIGVAGNVNDTVSDKARKPVDEEFDDDLDDYDFSIDEGVVQKIKDTRAAKKEFRNKRGDALDAYEDFQEKEEERRRQEKKESDRRYRKADAEYQDSKNAAKKEYKDKRREIWRGKKEELDMIDEFLDGDSLEEISEANKPSVKASSQAISRDVAAGTAIVPASEQEELSDNVERGPQRHEDADSLDEAYDYLTNRELDLMLEDSLEETELFQNDGNNVNTFEDTDNMDNTTEGLLDEDEDDMDDELIE